MSENLSEDFESKLAKANEILKYQPAFLKNSVLPESQIKKIAQI